MVVAILGQVGQGKTVFRGLDELSEGRLEAGGRDTVVAEIPSVDVQDPELGALVDGVIGQVQFVRLPDVV